MITDRSRRRIRHLLEGPSIEQLRLVVAGWLRALFLKTIEVLGKESQRFARLIVFRGSGSKRERVGKVRPAVLE